MRQKPNLIRVFAISRYGLEEVHREAYPSVFDTSPHGFEGTPDTRAEY